MPSLTIGVSEADVVKLVLEFLHTRALHISLLALERESGVINGAYSDDMLFLRQLVLDGQWDDVIDFIQPLKSVESFNMTRFKYIIYKHKYLELLCIKAECAAAPSVPTNADFTVDEVVQCLNTRETLCPTREDYSNLCLLLTTPRLSDHVDYIDWNPSNARVECFKDVLPLVEKYLVLDRKHDNVGDERMRTANDDRLVQLCVKGLLYESCVDFCQHKATSPEYDSRDLSLVQLLDGGGFSDADVSLMSWLQSIPHATFSCPFEQRTVNLDLKPLVKPSLEASWCEQILVTPIKPKMFPHSAVPTSRRHSTDFMMTRSLQPQYDGLAHGLASARYHRETLLGGGDRATDGAAGPLSRSFAGGSAGGFQLLSNAGGGRRRSQMLESVDRLFGQSDIIDTHSSTAPSGADSTPRESPRNPHHDDVTRAAQPSSSPPPIRKPFERFVVSNSCCVQFFCALGS